MYDLTKGIYGVSVSIGKSYQTRQQQGADQFGQLLTANPGLVPVLGDIWMRFLDVPGAKEAAKRLKRMFEAQNPNLQDPDAPEDADTLRAQLMAGKQQFEQLHQAFQEAQEALKTDKVKSDAALQKAQMETQAKMQMSQMDAQQEAQADKSQGMLDVMLEKLKAQTAQDLELMKEEFAMEKLRQEQRFEALQAELERRHDEEMAEHAARVSADMADRDRDGKVDE